LAARAETGGWFAGRRSHAGHAFHHGLLHKFISNRIVDPSFPKRGCRIHQQFKLPRSSVEDSVLQHIAHLSNRRVGDSSEPASTAIHRRQSIIGDGA
jgi:hypothetical protein